MDQTTDVQTDQNEQNLLAEANRPVLFEEDDQDDEPPELGANVGGEEAAVEGEENREPTTAQQSPETKTFREMRKNFNGALKDKARLERELADIRAKLPKDEPTLGTKPTLDQYDYDETRFSEAYDNWMEQKSAMDAADRRKLDATRKQEEELNAFKESYAARAKSLGVDDFSEAETEVGSILNQTQTGLLMRGAEDPASLVYALSKSPARLVDLAKITDPVKFTVAIAKLEINLSAKRPNRPAPEPRLSSERTSGNSGGGSALDKLREEAARSGDYSKVVAYKKQNNIKS